MEAVMEFEVMCQIWFSLKHLIGLIKGLRVKVVKVKLLKSSVQHLASFRFFTLLKV